MHPLAHLAQAIYTLSQVTKSHRKPVHARLQCSLFECGSGRVAKTYCLKTAPFGRDRIGLSTFVSQTPIFERMPLSCASDSRRCPASGSCMPCQFSARAHQRMRSQWSLATIILRQAVFHHWNRVTHHATDVVRLESNNRAVEGLPALRCACQNQKMSQAGRRRHQPPRNL